MAHDFFLIERASQLQRLRSGNTEVTLEIPGKLARSGFSPSAMQLFQMLDRVEEIPLDRTETGIMPWLKAQRDRLLPGSRSQEGASGMQLARKHRDVLISFEKQVVRDILGDDADARQVASHVISSLEADYPQFIGWKPLQIHDDSFAHEFLFPSWLNLYSVLGLAEQSGGSARFSEEQIRAVFQFLEDQDEWDAQVEEEVVGAMTFAARRLPVQPAHRFMQRLLDLGSALGTRFATDEVERLRFVREAIFDGEELLPALGALVTCDACPLKMDNTWRYRVLPKRLAYQSLPSFLATAVGAMPSSDDDATGWIDLVRHLGTIVDAAGGLNSELVELLHERQDSLGDWLGLASNATGAAPLSDGAQRMLARLVRRDGANSADRYAAFARTLAPRMDQLSQTAWAVFEADFVDSDANRDFVLRQADQEAGRRRVAQQLTKAAQATRDTGKMLGRLHLAAVMDPDCDAGKLHRVGRTLKVLGTLQAQGFISTKQFEELLQDIRQRLPGSAEFLAMPLLGGREAPTQLSRLYLALNEVCEVYEHTQEVVNFGMTKAAFSHLDWEDDEE